MRDAEDAVRRADLYESREIRAILIESVVADRYRGDFTPLIEKMRRIR